jgi:hypothetical protein
MSRWRERLRSGKSHQRAEALQRLANGETQADIARTYAVDPTTIGRLEATAVGNECPCHGKKRAR